MEASYLKVYALSRIAGGISGSVARLGKQPDLWCNASVTRVPLYQGLGAETNPRTLQFPRVFRDHEFIHHAILGPHVDSARDPDGPGSGSPLWH